MMNKKLKVILLSLAVCVTLVACSDEPSVKDAKSVFEHPKEPVTSLEKHKFELEFSDDCVERELKNSTNKTSDKPRIEKACTCISEFMMKDLTAIEAEKVLEEDSDTQSLRIRFDNAAYNCLQENQPEQSPKLFINPKASKN